MNESRQVFLNSYWVKYPNFDPSLGHFGRIEEIDSNHVVVGQEIWKWSANVQWIKVELGASGSKPWEVLQPGDLIGFFVIHQKNGGTSPNKNPQPSSNEIAKIILYATGSETKIAASDCAEKFAPFLRAVRDFFYRQNFDEVLTPTLVRTPGSEPSIDFLEVQVKENNQSQTLYLPSSPEISLKKVISRTLKNSFEIHNSFRNNESTPVHSQEFYLLEWYRTFQNLEQIHKDVENLITDMCHIFDLPVPVFNRLSVQELFQRHLGISLQPHDSKERFQALCQKLNLGSAGASGLDSIDDLFFRIWIDKIEPHISPNEVLFVTDFPPFQAAYSKLDPQTGWAQRFEVYWKGVELANAFQEVNDPDLQLSRMQQDNQNRKQKGWPVVPIDPEFIQSLRNGFPPSAGIALGVDRLAMIILNARQIDDLRFIKKVREETSGL